MITLLWPEYQTLYSAACHWLALVTFVAPTEFTSESANSAAIESLAANAQMTTVSYTINGKIIYKGFSRYYELGMRSIRSVFYLLQYHAIV